MTLVIIYCKKCGYESSEFDNLDDIGYDHALNDMKEHMKTKHPRVRKVHSNLDFRYLGGQKT